MREALEDRFGAPEEAELTWRPQNTVQAEEAQAGTLLKLLDALDDNDDGAKCLGQFEIDDAVLAG